MPVLSPLLHLVLSIFHPKFKSLYILGRTPRKTLAQFDETGWQDEQIQQTPAHQFILTSSDLDGSLHVNIKQNVNTPPEVFIHMALEGPIPAIMNPCVLEQLTPLNSHQEVLFIQEIIVNPVNLTRAGLSRRA
jgi:hypothetical protein